MAGSNQNALDVLLAEIRKLADDSIEQVNSGLCKDFADYRYRCGIIHGLRLSERELIDLKKRIEEA